MKDEKTAETGFHPSGESATHPVNVERPITLPPEIAQRLARHRVQIRGQNSPEKIPLSSLLSYFARAVQRSPSIVDEVHNRLPLLSQEDQLALTDVISLVAHGEIHGLKPLIERMAILRNDRAGTGDAVVLERRGRDLSEIQGEIRALTERHYESALSNLSSDGKRTLMNYLYREIAPRASISWIDYEGMYRELAQLLPRLKALQAEQRTALGESARGQDSR